MRKLESWFDEYSESHQNKTNKAIHYFCVPAIFFSICGLLMSIPSHGLSNISPSIHPIITNWAFVALIFVNIFYLRLSIAMSLKMVLFSLACLIGNYLIGQVIGLWQFSLSLFVVAWVGQFYGHKIEGKKPSFLKDIQFLLIGPAWVMHNWTGKFGVQEKVQDQDQV